MIRRLPLPMVPALSALLFLVAPAVGAPSDDDLFFFDDFDGSTLDASKWETAIAVTGIRYMNEVWTMPPADGSYGLATVADSHVTLENSSPTFACPMFPLVWTNHAIPETGNFQLEFRMKYNAPGYWGDGVRIVRMSSPFEPAPGSTQSAKGDYVLMIHQDNVDCKGPQVSLLRHPGTGSPSLPFNTDWHTYTLKYENAKSTLYIDGDYFDGPLPTPRPNCIQLGVGEVGCCADSCDCCGCNWVSYSVDYISVRLLAPTPTTRHTWGELKARYR
ncbi:MAG: hypothetical protein E6K73_04130 [Candidatus Eisenbacteria bacterium]|uniref:LamG domain-containing protein n=1 Tax=Eiseniibacteriota bacterium TaxID=2212470 RepID=A0A538SKS5_UNCEI|nr:MAG: hypothetical protein E6K73_04130 [Candidatus Eisenbacteria bacterium]